MGPRRGLRPARPARDRRALLAAHAPGDAGRRATAAVDSPPGVAGADLALRPAGWGVEAVHHSGKTCGDVGRQVFYLGTKDYIDSWKPEPPDPKEAAAQESGKEASEGPAATEDLGACKYHAQLSALHLCQMII